MRNRRNKRKKTGSLSALVLLLGGLFLLSGCGGTQIELPEEHLKTKLRVVTMFGNTSPNGQVYGELLYDFEQAHPEVLIENESQESDEIWKSQVVADFCAGNEPDVLQFFTDATADSLIIMDKLVPLQEIRKEYPSYGKDTYEWALQMVENTDGVSRAVPTTGFWEGLYCNEALFEACNLELPGSWEELMTCIRVFREQGICPVACALNTVPHYWMEHLLLYTLGEDLYQKDFSSNPELWEKGLALFQELRDAGTFPEDTDTADNAAMWERFQRGEAAMILEGSWFLPTMEDGEQITVIPFPGVPDQRCQQGVLIGGMTTGFYITQRAWNHPERRAAAVAFVEAQTNRDAIRRYWEKGNGTAIAACGIAEKSQRTGLAAHANQLLREATDYVLPTDSRVGQEAYQILISGIMNISHGQDPGEVLRRAEEEWKEGEE